MKTKTQILAVFVPAIAAGALLVPVVQAGTGTPGSDANERSDAGVVATSAMQDAHQRVGIVSESRSLVDAHERGGPRISAPVSTGSGIVGAGFDWGAAAVGASSALLLALLVGTSLLTVRHYRGAVPH